MLESIDLKNIHTIQYKFIKKCVVYLSNHVPFNERKIFVAGGFFSSFYHNLEINDIDVYCNSPESFGWALQQYKNCGYEIYKDITSKYFAKLENKSDKSAPNIDLIGFHEPKSVAYIRNFDFRCCRIAVDAGKFYQDTFALDDIENKRISVPDIYIKYQNNPDHNPIERLLKYINEKGFTINDNHKMNLVNLIKHGQEHQNAFY